MKGGKLPGNLPTPVANFYLRSKVYYNLFNSNFVYRLVYPNHVVEYVFSSEYHLNKFVNRYDGNRELISNKLSTLEIHVEFNLYADIVLYTKIESRGFLIILDGGSVICPGDIKLLDSVNQTKSLYGI